MAPPLHLQGLPLVRILDEDPDLAAGLDAPAQGQARLVALAPLLTLPKGDWHPPDEALDPARDFGLLVLDGLLSRDQEIAGRIFTELRGPEDLLRPWDDTAEAASITGQIRWRALEPTRVAWLNSEFSTGVAQWPEITSALLARAIRRARLMSIRVAILELNHVHLRVLLLLWHLADRWGRVQTEGVYLELRLTHELLARMVGAHRTSVTLALNKLADEHRVKRVGRQGWLLLGPPPTDLTDTPRAPAQPLSKR